LENNSLRDSVEKIIYLIIFLSISGGVIKTLGSVLGGSKSVFVDAMTCIANSLSIILILRFFKVGLKPPDVDHHYGHGRMILGGQISTLMLYSFVAGVIVVDLLESVSTGYTISISAPIFASIGMIPYIFAIIISRKYSSITLAYTSFTIVELIESGVSITTSFGGATISYLIDFAGAIALTSYLFYELVKHFRGFVFMMSDIAPEGVVEEVAKSIARHGVGVEKIRIRKVIENVYQGDIVVTVPPNMSLEMAHEIADKIGCELKDKYNLEASIHLEPSKKKEGDQR